MYWIFGKNPGKEHCSLKIIYNVSYIM
jgi:hypothetical protein